MQLGKWMSVQPAFSSTKLKHTQIERRRMAYKVRRCMHLSLVAHKVHKMILSYTAKLNGAKAIFLKDICNDQIPFMNQS